MEKISRVLLGLLATFLVIQIIASLQWRIQHDSPLLLYLAWLMDQFGAVPYRDFFDMNTPGSYWAYLLIGRITNLNDFSFRLIDLALLGCLGFVTYHWLKKISPLVALAGATLFAIVYLRAGPEMSLQREYLALVLMIAALALSSSERLGSRWKNLLVGFLFGLSATIKPQATIGLVSILVMQAATIFETAKQERRQVLRSLMGAWAWLIGGLLVPLVLVLVYLWSQNGLDDFILIVRNYWPLYGTINGNLESLGGTQRIRYLVQSFINLGGYQLWLAPAALGLFIALFDSALSNAQKRQVILVALFTLTCSIYPVIGGKFWNYHWLMFAYFIVQLSALCLLRPSTPSALSKQIFPIVVLLIAIGFNLYVPTTQIVNQIRGRAPLPPKNGRVDEIAAYLDTNQKPGDTAQPLDITGGAVHAMLIARTPLATRFIYDPPFYHNVSHPYIQSLRQEFVTDLKNAPPRFIIYIHPEASPWVSGPDTTRQFESLQNLLDQTYRVAVEKNGYRIYERR